MGDKGKTAGSAILRYVIIIAVMILLGGGFAAIRSYVSSHSKQFSQAEYQDLNPLVEAGETLPAGKWGRVSVRWVLDTFASEENTYSTYGVKFNAGKAYYYLAVLDNYQSIAIEAADEAEIARLNQMAESFWAAEDIHALPHEDFEGKIEKLSNKQLSGFYEEALKSAGFLDEDTLIKVQYLTLNTAAIPSQNMLLYIGAAAVVIVALIVALRMRKKRRQEAAEEPPAPAPADQPQE